MTGNEISRIEGEGRLGADLRELRAALRELRAPARDHDALRDAFRAQRRTAPPASEAARPRWRRAPAIAAAAVLVAGIMTGVLLSLDRFDRAGSEQAPLQVARRRSAEPSGAFQPLLYAPAFSPTGSYSVVRVRIPLSSLAIGQGADLDGMIEADVLLGEDGLASGIRFDVEDTLLVSTVSR